MIAWTIGKSTKKLVSIDFIYFFGHFVRKNCFLEISSIETPMLQGISYLHLHITVHKCRIVTKSCLNGLIGELDNINLWNQRKGT